MSLNNLQLIKSQSIKDCILIFIFSKVLFVCEYIFLIKHCTTQLQKLPFITNWFRWDALWYFNIINQGYAFSLVRTNGEAPWNFWPGFPLLIKLFTFLGLNLSIVSLVINQWLLLMSMIILYNYCEETINDHIGIYSVIFLAISFENIYFMAIYTETLFLFLSLLTFYCLRHNRFWLSSICNGLLSSIRFVGFLSLFAILLYKYRHKQFTAKAIIVHLAQTIVAVTGIICFSIYLHFHVGNALAFYYAHKMWLPDVSLINWLLHPQLVMSQIWAYSNYEYVALIIAVICLIYLCSVKLYEEALWVMLCVLPILLQANLNSSKRYIFALFPVYMLFGHIAAKYKIIGIFLLLFMILAQFILSFYWLSWDFVAA